MALQSEVSPPIVGDPNKDTKNDGDTKSDENETSSSTDEDVDLEEGEILDSGEEAEKEEEKKDLTNSSLQEAVDKNILKSIEQLVSQTKSDISPPNVTPKRLSPHNSPIKRKKRSEYLDPDRFEDNSDQEDGWYSSSRKHKSKFDSKPIDYRKELDAYIGTPPSSPERKHRDDKKKRPSKKSKKSGKKTIKRKDIKGDRVKGYIKDSLRRKMCKFFKEGKCAKGADCGFSHASPHSFKKKELCKFYLSGHCNKGPGCTFMHKEFPCKFYHTGSECYAKEACRFSHEPLTDEMKRVLADYLRMHHGDDDYDRDRDRDRERERDRERKRRRTPSPEVPKPPTKRTCLLGSPPRHIREAEETKRWQEEMSHLQHPGFKININSGEELLPPAFQKPNFYQETLLDSPNKQRMNPDAPTFHPVPFGPRDIDDRFPVPSSSDIFVYEEDYQDNDEDERTNIKQEPENYEWNNNMHGPNHNMPPVVKTEMEPFIEQNQQEPDFTSDVKFDETTQFSEMESSIDCHPNSPPSTTSHQNHSSARESDEESSNQDVTKSEDYKTTDDSSSAQEPPAAPILVPSHLPRKQQELFKRIQQHQLKHNITAAVSDASNSPKPFDSSDTQIKEEPEEVKDNSKEESLWYSSEDDDDDDTEPLTNVLKNLQKEPPPVKPESKPAQNLMAMLNKIQQKAMEKSKGISDPQQGSFFQNLLGTISAPRESLHIPGITVPTPEPVRRTLLPDPKFIAAVKEPVVAPKDPRLKNRDPRLAANTAPSLPKVLVPEVKILPVGSSLPKLMPMPTALSNTTVVVAEPVKEEIPYKLHGIFTTPPNYASYISASQNNPNLLKDPRLRKHMSKVNGVENSQDSDSAKLPAKLAPPIPKLLLKYNKNESLNINIFEPAKPFSASNEPSLKDAKPQVPKLLDPRMRRRESQNSSGSNTPPHLTIVDNSSPPQGNLKTAPILEREVKPSEEKKWPLSILDKSWTPPVLEQSWTPPIKQEQSWIPLIKQEQSWMPPIKQEQSWTPPVKQEQSWTPPIKQEQSWTPPVKQEQSWTPPVKQEQSWTPPIKQEDDSDTEDDYDPVRLEIDENPQSSAENIAAYDLSAVSSKKAKPTPASHLPRAIADPRMAKLQNPMHLRRPRIPTPEPVNKNPSELNRLNSPPNENSSDASRASPTDSVESESSLTVLSIPKKNVLSKRNLEKKKTVHRNRKSSMDYASPLNSCDDINLNKSLNYNSYNQRPKRTCTIKKNVLDSSVSNTTTITNSVVGDTTPDFLSDNSNLDCENSSDVNLKDMFKTIDPTASPFC